MGPALGAVKGVETAFIFGSWAARYRGEPGPDPADVDLIVVGRPARGALARVTRGLSVRVGREVNATIVSSDRWQKGTEGFLRSVKRGALVEVDLGRPSQGVGHPDRAATIDTPGRRA